MKGAAGTISPRELMGVVTTQIERAPFAMPARLDGCEVALILRDGRVWLGRARWRGSRLQLVPWGRDRPLLMPDIVAVALVGSHRWQAPRSIAERQRRLEPLRLARVPLQAEGGAGRRRARADRR